VWRENNLSFCARGCTRGQALRLKINDLPMASHVRGEGMRNRLLLILGACLMAAAAAQASPITYDFSGTLYGSLGATSPTSGAMTGWLTVDDVSGLLQDFSIALPQLGGLNPWNGTSYTATKANSYITLNQSMEYQIEAYNYSDDQETVMNLIFNSLPGAIHTGVGPSSGVLQAPLFGGNWTFLSSLTGTASLPQSEVPEPPSVWLLASGLLMAGLLVPIRRRHAAGV